MLELVLGGLAALVIAVVSHRVGRSYLIGSSLSGVGAAVLFLAITALELTHDSTSVTPPKPSSLESLGPFVVGWFFVGLVMGLLVGIPIEYIRSLRSPPGARARGFPVVCPDRHTDTLEAGADDVRRP